MQQQAAKTSNRQHDLPEATNIKSTNCTTASSLETHATTKAGSSHPQNGQQTLFDAHHCQTTANHTTPATVNNNNNSNYVLDNSGDQQYHAFIINNNNNNNNHLDGHYHPSTRYVPYSAPNNYSTPLSQHEPQLQSPNQIGSEPTPETISFDLEDIQQVINGVGFDYQNERTPPIKQEYDTDPRQQQETEAAIYENLRNILIDLSDESTSQATTPSPNRGHTEMAVDQQGNKNNNNNCDAYDPTNELFNPLSGSSPSTSGSKPYVEIIEQPAKCALRFRYQCEGRSAGSLPGVNSTPDNKTYPTIRINNYRGRAVVVISCVTKDAPYRTHPHNVVGKEGSKKGICTFVLDADAPAGEVADQKAGESSNRDHQTPSPTTDGAATTSISSSADSNCMVRTFSRLGVQCVKRKDIADSLGLRESINVDPFRNGFSHKFDASAIDLNVVRLCFQVFIEGSSPSRCDIPLTPVVSDPIHDKKAMSDLIIAKLSHSSAPATGGREIILLCDRISKDDIQIRFFEESRDGKLVWETLSDISAADIHKQFAISFRTPKYYNEEITQPVMVNIQLRRISDQQVSEPRPFQFLPCESDEDIISRKQKKVKWCNMNQYALGNIIQASSSHHQQRQQQPIHPRQEQLQQRPEQPSQHLHHHHQQQHFQQQMQSSAQQQQHHQQQLEQQQQQQQHMSLMTRQQQQQ